MPSDDPSDYFCTRDADKSLKDALCGGNQPQLRRWCRENPEKLRLALDWIHHRHTEYRKIVEIELDDLRRKDQEEKYIEIHGRITALEKPHWTTTPGFWISVISFLILLLATYFAWLAIPPDERPYLHLSASAQTSSLSTPTPASSPLKSPSQTAP